MNIVNLRTDGLAIRVATTAVAALLLLPSGVRAEVVRADGFLPPGLVSQVHNSTNVQSDSTAQKTANAKNQFSISLGHLTHGEVRAGGLPRDPALHQNMADEVANFIMGRTRLTFDFRRDKLEAKAVAQNQAVWGAKGNTALAIYEAWARYSAKMGLFAQLGRIALSYDDERIIGPNDWAMASKTHDLIRAGYEGHGHKAHVLLAYNQNVENLTTGTYYIDGAQQYKSMQTLWYHFDVPKVPVGISLLFMNLGLQAGIPDENEHQEHQQLIGGYLNAHPWRLTLEGSYYRQMGHNENGKKINAWMASGKASLTLSKACTLQAGYDYISGDDYVAVPKPGGLGTPEHKEIKGFTSLYGSRHKFYGVMDYFYESAYLNGFTPGLQNAYVGVKLAPMNRLNAKASYHYMATATKLEGLSRTLGHDLEVEASYRLASDVSLSVGFAYMNGTETMNRLKQGTSKQNVKWGWFSLVVTPSLFTTKW